MGTIAFALNDVCVKTLGKKFDPSELAFFRYLVGFIILSPVFMKMDWGARFRSGVSGHNAMIGRTARTKP